MTMTPPHLRVSNRNPTDLFKSMIQDHSFKFYLFIEEIYNNMIRPYISNQQEDLIPSTFFPTQTGQPTGGGRGGGPAPLPPTLG